MTATLTETLELREQCARLRALADHADEVALKACEHAGRAWALVRPVQESVNELERMGQ